MLWEAQVRGVGGEVRAGWVVYSSIKLVERSWLDVRSTSDSARIADISVGSSRANNGSPITLAMYGLKRPPRGTVVGHPSSSASGA